MSYCLFETNSSHSRFLRKSLGLLRLDDDNGNNGANHNHGGNTNQNNDNNRDLILLAATKILGSLILHISVQHSACRSNIQNLQHTQALHNVARIGNQHIYSSTAPLNPTLIETEMQDARLVKMTTVAVHDAVDTNITAVQLPTLEESKAKLLHTHHLLLHKNTPITVKRVRHIVRQNLYKEIITGNLPVLPIVGNAGDIPSVAQMKQLAGAIARSVRIVGYVQLEERGNALFVSRESPNIILRYR